MNFLFFLYWFEVYSLYSSRTLDKFCEVLFNRVISQTHRLIFVTLGTRLWWSLELQPCYFSNSSAHLCHFRHQIIMKSRTSTGLFLNWTKSFVTNRWFSLVLAHTYRAAVNRVRPITDAHHQYVWAPYWESGPHVNRPWGPLHAWEWTPVTIAF